MKRLLPLLLGAVAAIAALVIWWPSSPTEPAPVTPPGGEETLLEDQQAAPAVSEATSAESTRSSERQLIAARGQQGAGVVNNLLLADGPTGIRAMDSTGQTLAPATFLVRTSNAPIEWIDSPTGELRFAELTSIRSIAAFAQGSWSDPVVMDHSSVRHEQVDLLVHRPAAAMNVRVTVAGLGSDDASSCRYEFRPGPSEDSGFQLNFAREEVIQWEAFVDSSGLGQDHSLFGDAFAVYQAEDPRAEVNDGSLLVDQLPAGWYFLTAQSERGITETRSVELKSGQTEDVYFELVEGGFVHGRALQADSSPIEGVWIGGLAKTEVFAEFLGTEQLMSRAETFGADGRRAVTTDANGEFRLGPITPGETMFLALSNGYLPARFADIEVLPSQDLKLPDAFLRKGHSLAALVRDAETGAVLEEAIVRWRFAGDDLLASAADWREAEERDQAGRHLLHNLPFRPIQVEARASGFGAERQQYVIAERDWSSDLELPQLEYQLKPGATVTGTVVDADGQAVANAEVLARLTGSAANPWEFLAERQTDEERIATTDDAGAFVLRDLPAENWTLVAQADGHAPGMSRALDLTDQTRASVEIQLPRPAKVTVQYRDQQGATLRGHTILLTQMETLAPLTGSTDEAGQAVFEDLAPGEYTLQVIPAGLDQQALSEGSFAMEFKGLELEVGESKTVEVGPGLADAQLSGQLTRDGVPAPGVTFTLLGGGGFNSKRTDDDGRFEFEELVPGTYSWFAGPGQAAAIAGELAVETGENEFQYELPGGGLEVRVVSDATSEPVTGIPVTATIDNTLGNPVLALTDSDGLARFEFLEPGNYRVAAGSASMPMFGGDNVHGARFEDIQVGSQSQEVELRLEEAATFRVRALDLNGNPLAGASMFYLRDDGQPLSQLSMKATNSKGVAELSGLPAGPGRMLVRHPTGGQKEFSVQLTAGQLSKQEVRLDEGVTVYLKIVDASGEAPAGVFATLRDDRGVRITMMYSMQDAQAAQTAIFSGQEQKLGPVAPGSYTLEVFRLGGDVMSQELTVPADGPEFRRTVVYRP